VQYEGNIIRPPSEAHSIILQVTAGCSHNKCIFCGAYKNTPFRVRSECLAADLEYAANNCQHQNRVFLADGDALILPFPQLLSIFEKIKIKLPWVNKVSLYANGKAIRSKTTDQLLALKKLGLDRIYLGLESGHDQVLDLICKGETATSMIDAAQKIRECGLYLSVTILLGIGGKKLSQEHARQTGDVLTRMAPNQIAALSVMPLPNTLLFELIQKGKFTLPDKTELLAELKTIIKHIRLDRVQFHSNHASNYLPLSGRLQKDTETLLSRIDSAMAGTTELVPEYLRSL
jgi:radical SAM superfamily enzyme YgiQ (UPF0313 family)